MRYAIGDFLQDQWEKIYGIYNYNDFHIFVFGTFILIFLAFWGFGLVYLFMDLTGKPSFLVRYRTQDDSKYSMPSDKVLQLVQQCLVNLLVFTVPSIVVFYYAASWRGYDNARKLPSAVRVGLEIGVSALIHEFSTYYLHRMLHHPRFYERIHKLHHSWTAPIALSALYSQPVEYILGTVFPIALGPLILGSHLATAWLWIIFGLLNGLHVHSGFHFPFFTSPEAHDYHHLKSNENYGVLGLLDRFHGTDSTFRKSKHSLRHKIFFSPIPPKEMYPDDSQKK